MFQSVFFSVAVGQTIGIRNFLIGSENIRFGPLLEFFFFRSNFGRSRANTPSWNIFHAKQIKCVSILFACCIFLSYMYTPHPYTISIQSISWNVNILCKDHFHNIIWLPKFIMKEVIFPTFYIFRCGNENMKSLISIIFLN